MYSQSSQFLVRQHDSVLDQRLFPSCNFQPRPLGVIFDIDPIVCCPFDTLEHITSVTNSENGVVILDPSRKRRSDYTPEVTVSAVQEFWAANTRPCPDAYPIATMTMEDGTKVQHGIHWKEQ